MYTSACWGVLHWQRQEDRQARCLSHSHPTLSSGACVHVKASEVASEAVWSPEQAEQQKTNLAPPGPEVT